MSIDPGSITKTFLNNAIITLTNLLERIVLDSPEHILNTIKKYLEYSEFNKLQVELILIRQPT